MRIKKTRRAFDISYHPGVDKIPHHITLLNEDGKAHGPGGNIPAAFSFTKEGKLFMMSWMRDGIEHGDGLMPSTIGVDPNNFFQINLLSFKKNGRDYQHPCGHHYIWFASNGAFEDESGDEIDVDFSKIPLDLKKSIETPAIVMPFLFDPP